MTRNMSTVFEGRHPSVMHFQALFAFSHLPPDLQAISVPFADLAVRMLAVLEDGPELAAGLRKLMEAKDCMVRQAVQDRDQRDADPAPDAVSDRGGMGAASAASMLGGRLRVTAPEAGAGEVGAQCPHTRLRAECLDCGAQDVQGIR